jgi:conjugative coupling factor TraD (SXT/TOL subfamily)
VGGLPRLHGIEPDEVEVTLPLAERVGHTLVLGTTRVGKTRLAELLITQDIRRKIAGQHEICIVFDPKGDADLLRRMYLEAKRAGREGEFYVFHLGQPDTSARYNAIGRFGRITEVASRLAGQLSGEGNSAAFREFAWRFVNIIARALVELGRRPDYLLIQRHVVNIDPLFVEYAAHFFAKHDPKAWEAIVQIEGKLNEKNTPRHMAGRDKRVVAIELYLNRAKLYDPVLEGLRSAVRYDRTYFDKIVASLLPLLEKLTTGKIAQLLAPTTPTSMTRDQSSTGCRSSANGPSSTSAWIRCPTRKWRLRWAIPCLPTWCRWRDTSTSSAWTMACRAAIPAKNCRSICTRTNSMS